MSKIARAMQQAAGGAGGDPLHKVFSIDAWYGNQSSQTINNGINLASRGGLVMITPYEDDGTANMMNSFYDTVRGDNKVFKFGNGKWTGSGVSDYTSSAYSGTDGTSVTLANSLSFTNTGYTIGSALNPNYFGKPYHAYTFRIAEKFFDIVSWTGNGSNPRTFTHNLKIKPGMIWGLNLTDASDIFVYHQFASYTTTSNSRVSGWIDGNKIGYLRGQGGDTFWADTDSFGGESPWNSTANAPTATEFKVGANLNASGKEYIAYLWAHDNSDTPGEFSKIKCSYWINPVSANYNYNPASPSSPTFSTNPFRAGLFTWANVASGTGHMMVIDQMSGMNDEAYSDGLDYSKTWSNWTKRNYGHQHSVNYVNKQADTMRMGGSTSSGHMGYGQNNHFMVGMAVADPTWTEVPSSPNDVFTVGGYGSNSGGWDTTHRVNTSLITSNLIPMSGSGSNHLALMSSNMSGRNYRLNYGSGHSSDWHTDMATSGNDKKPGFYNTGHIPTATNSVDHTSKYALGMWKESKGYHSVDMYHTYNTSSGNASAYISLGVRPDFFIIQPIHGAGNQPKTVYHKYIHPTGDKNDYYLEANNSKPAQNSADWWGDADPETWYVKTNHYSASQIYFNAAAGHQIWKPADSSYRYMFMVYAWAAKPGFSHFGAYTGNGNATGPSIDCGFAAGARCVMIKNVSEHQAWLWVNPYGSAGTVDFQVKVGYNANNESSSSGTLADNQDIQFISNEDVVDKTSNGFQIKGTNPNRNKSGDRYIYGAWA